MSFCIGGIGREVILLVPVPEPPSKDISNTKCKSAGYSRKFFSLSLCYNKTSPNFTTKIAKLVAFDLIFLGILPHK